MNFLYWLEDIRTPLLDKFFSLLTHLGGETVFIAAAILVYWCISKKNGLYLLTVGLFGTLASQLLKLVCHVPRPWVRDPDFTIVEAARADAAGYSFPSGHTQNVVSALGSPARAWKNRTLRIVAVVLILLVALSRMYLGVHTPADVGVGLVLGGVLVFALWPCFADEKKPRRMYGAMFALIACSIAYVLFVELFPWPTETDAENLAEGLKNGYLVLGCSCAMPIAMWLEGKHIRFKTEAPLLGQILKVALGLALVMLLKTLLKPLCNALFGGHPAATALRYFVVLLFGTCVWPLTFPAFAKKSKCILAVLLAVILVLAILAGILLWVVSRDTKAAPIESDNAANSLITPLGVTMLSGHRAGGGIAPENTMMALRNCVESDEYELDIFEFDIHLTADGVPVLLHDETLDRTSDAAVHFGETDVDVGSKTLAELKELNMGAKFVTESGEKPFVAITDEAVRESLRIVTLEEALTYLEANGEYRYIIEIKNSGETGYKAADILYDTLCRFECLERTVVGTFHNEITAYMDSTYPDMPRSAGMNECVKFYAYCMLGLKAKPGTFPYVALQIPTTYSVINMATTRLVNYAHQNGIAVQYWTINDPAEMAKLQSIGADAVMTDVPDQAAAVLVQP